MSSLPSSPQSRHLLTALASHSLTLLDFYHLLLHLLNLGLLLFDLRLCQKSLKSFSIVLTDNLILIIFPLGFLNLVLQFSFLLSPISASCVCQQPLKKSTLNSNQLSNYRPISNLSLISN